METVIISLGGSLIVPDEIDIAFLKEFKKIILKHTNKEKRFVIITGGGKTCRKYQAAANSITKLTDEDMDWLGIHVTRLNAHLMRSIFHKEAHPRIIKNPTEKMNFRENILIAAGWKPGCSTDFDAILLAKNLDVKKLVNLSNIDYAYDKDPNKFKDAKPIFNTTWKEFRKILPKKWDPGLNSPFDPIASKEAEKLGMEVAILNGKNLENFDKYLSGKEFSGTRIHL